MRRELLGARFYLGVGLFAVSVGVVFGFQNCSRTQLGDSGGGSSSANSVQSLTGAELINVSAATTAQCPAGGQVYSIYIDSNENGIQDSSEPTLNKQIVCNGQVGPAGTPGLSSLFSMARVTVGTSICSAGTGVQLSAGLDVNKNGILDNSEILTTEVLCDGANGAPGADGVAGTNGHSMVATVTSVPTSVCPAGGSLILMALDVQDSGVYSPADPEQQSITVCNGVSGISAPPSPYTPVQVFTPCGVTVSPKEILMLLQNGQILASYSDSSSGTNTRLTFLPDGGYVDTDDSNCVFNISTSLDGKTRSISWLGVIQQTWNMP